MMLFRSPRWDAVAYWALDLETSGLRPRSDEIIAVAALPIRGGVIRYGERFDTLVRPVDLAAVPTDGLRAHHILPQELEDAPPLATVLRELDARLGSAVLLLHFAPLDLGFLRRAYRRTGITWTRPRVIDTVRLLVTHARRTQRFVPHPLAPPTELSAARAAFGLPPHRAHQALADALATAELFLVLRARLGARTVRDLM